MFKETNGIKFFDEKKKLILSSLIKKKSLDNSRPKKIKTKKKNLKYANIIINMNQNRINTNFNLIKEQNAKKLFYIQSSEKNILNEKANFSPKVLSILIQGIISLKTNDILGYTIKLCEIILYIKNNNKNPYFNIYDYLYVNNEFLNMIYETYFELFSKDTPTFQILKHDYNKDQEIFKKIHLIYIFYIFTGINYLSSNNSSKNKNSQILNFLKNLLEKEKCKKCFLCAEIEKITNIRNKKIFLKKTSVLRVGKHDYHLTRNNMNNLDKIYYGNFCETEQINTNLNEVNNDNNKLSKSQKISVKKIKENKNINNNDFLKNNINDIQINSSYHENYNSNDFFNCQNYYNSFKKLPKTNNYITYRNFSKSAPSTKIRNKSGFKIFTEKNQNISKYLKTNNNNNNISPKDKRSFRNLQNIFPKTFDLKNKNSINNSKLAHSSKQLVINFNKENLRNYNNNSNSKKLKNIRNTNSSKILKINYELIKTEKKNIIINNDISNKKSDNNNEIIENCIKNYLPSIQDKIKIMENKLKDFQIHNDKIKKQLFLFSPISNS